MLLSLESGTQLLKCVFNLDLELCPNCGGELKIIRRFSNGPRLRRFSIILGCEREHHRARLPVGRMPFKASNPSG
jgi:hypothetical protein